MSTPTELAREAFVRLNAEWRHMPCCDDRPDCFQPPDRTILTPSRMKAQIISALERIWREDFDAEWIDARLDWIARTMHAAPTHLAPQWFRDWWAEVMAPPSDPET